MGPGAGGYSNRFIAMPSYRTRSIGMQMFGYGIKGFLHWGYNFYNTQYSREQINSRCAVPVLSVCSLDLNLKGPFYFAHAALKQMREQKSGLILNIGSITGMEGDGYGMEYPTAKAGINKTLP